MKLALLFYSIIYLFVAANSLAGKQTHKEIDNGFQPHNNSVCVANTITETNSNIKIPDDNDMEYYKDKSSLSNNDNIDSYFEKTNYGSASKYIYNASYEAVSEIFFHLNQIYKDSSRSILHNCMDGDFDLFLTEFNKNPSVINSTYTVANGFFKYPLLLFAVRGGNLKIVEFLLNNGADVESNASSGKSALIYSVALGYYEIVELLIKHGALINSGHPLYYASLANNYAVAKLLLFNNAEINIQSSITDNYLPSCGCNIKANINSPLMAAAISGGTEVLKLLIDNGADVNYKGENGNTALHYAASSSAEAVKILINNNATIDSISSKYNMTPLIMAIIVERPEIAKILIENGANVNHANFQNNTPLILAAKYNLTEIAELLIEKQAMVNHNNYYDNTALHYATYNNNNELVKILLENGADVNIQDSIGMTPVMYAAQRGFDSSITQLLKKNADLSLENNDGYNALDLAALFSNQENIVRKLLDTGYDLQIRMVTKYNIPKSMLNIIETKKNSNFVAMKFRYIVEYLISMLYEPPIPYILD